METNEIKRQHIIDTALRRFSHFGINKTTMSEIADDISVSKANLYYYFPDKTALVVDVIKHLIDEGTQAFNKILDTSTEVLDMLFRLLEIRKNFFEKHYLLHITIGFADSNLNMEQIQKLGSLAEANELEILEKIFEKGIKSKELVTFDIRNTSQIYFTILRGISMVSIAKVTNKDIPEISVFNEIFEKQKKASVIFVNGLRHELLNN
ncbi:TetR/AcrR family transcriptional regulator [Olivibacter sp. SDN3]|uniref:TetR/AcrR family transcriptional regulator n=1 Tax=Olivibacter sp. SDN3 TaxID=2764720 RepID=UPI001650E952|nr:TetR/AcrR family transcriptional regulator [Olivibacter sp. SDN3]QNL51484.1 TetR/AcrR family transcriptional regulator [Olivibacter sp. SDN3]